MSRIAELLVVSEVASVTRLKESTVRAWILKRKLPYVKLGRRVLVRRDSLEKLLEESTVPAIPHREEA